jgi:hypothetical protein
MKVSQLMIISGLLTLLIPQIYYALNSNNQSVNIQIKSSQNDLAKKETSQPVSFT